MKRWLPAVLGAYLLGSVSFSVLVVRRATGRDLRGEGSGNPGATNALRSAGPRVGAATLALDVGKGAAAVALPLAAGAPAAVAGSCAVAVVLGHVYPAFFGFRGGKGVATSFGAFLPLAPWATAAAAGVFALGSAVSRYVSVGSMAAAASLPALVALGRRRGLVRREASVLAAATATAGLVIARHLPNLRRLLAGREFAPRRARTGPATVRLPEQPAGRERP